MKVDLLPLMKEFYESQGIQILFCKDLMDEQTQIDYKFRQQFFKNYDLSRIQKIINDTLRPGTLYCIEDDFLLNYIVFIVPETLREECGCRIIIVGPVMFQTISNGEFQKIIDDYCVPPELHLQLKTFYNRIPKFGNFDQWSTSLASFFTALLGKRPEIITFCGKDEFLHYVSHDDYVIPCDSAVSMKALEDRYAVEAEMMNAVSCGKTEEAIATQVRFRQYTIAPRTPDPVRNRKNMMIILNVLLRIAAQRGHVHPLHIDNLSTQIAVEIENASPSALKTIDNKMIRKYCMLVQNYSRRSYSPLVQNCLDYIDFHYAEDLSLDSLACRFSVSNSYLSSLFKKEIQMTLTDYINKTRIRQSLIFLNSTGLSIQEIAIRCGFSDSNYFTRTFKKFQGQSPKGYRESILRKERTDK
ncbi:MAG: helix-turn-helix transcriptional regulator [Brotaphodocola sp.]